MKTQAKTQHRCAACGFSSSKWFGKCPDCAAWSTAAPDVPAASLVEVRTLDLAEISSLERVATRIEEFDRVVGGGLVPGSVVLLAGEPGIGKSTLVLQVVDSLVKRGSRCLLATGEESLDQVSLRGNRLGLRTASMKAVATGSLEIIDAPRARCTATA
mgnify:CR=1 FL=1